MPPANPSQNESHADHAALADRAFAYYLSTLQVRLEPEHDGEGIAIHPESGDYLVAQTPTHASRAMWQRHPQGGIVTMRIGPSPDFALAASILAGRTAAQFQAHQQREAVPVKPGADL